MSPRPRKENAREHLCQPKELVALVKRGDIAALDRLSRCFGARLARVGQSVCRDPERAKDAVQDALLSAGEHLREFRGDGSLEGWLVRMVTNACHRMRRGRKNAPGLHATDVDLTSPDPNPELLAARGELVARLGTALADLAPLDRSILILAEVEGLTGPEVAKQVGLSAGAVRVRLTRARQRLRKRFGAEV